MAVLSIQSHVVYGYAGNTAAVFPLQRLGRETWAVNTVEFSNHTGYGAWRGAVLEPSLAGDLVLGIAERGALEQCEAVLSGYTGSAETGNSVIAAVRRVREAAPGALYCCDPVMGDLGRGIYVKEGILEKFRDEVIPLADIVTPNHFELELLSGMDTSRFEDAVAAAGKIHRLGPKAVLVTSYYEGTSPVRLDAEKKEFVQPDSIEMILSTEGAVYRVRTPTLPLPGGMAGSGDLCAAVFLSRWLDGAGPKRALELTAGSVFGIMEKTWRAGKREMLMIQAQDELVSPSHAFSAEQF